MSEGDYYTKMDHDKLYGFILAINDESLDPSAVVAAAAEHGITHPEFWELDTHPGRWPVNGGLHYRAPGVWWHINLRVARNGDNDLFDVLDRNSKPRISLVYSPIVTVEFVGYEVFSVSIDWSDSHQPGDEDNPDEADMLCQVFDKWLAEHNWLHPEEEG